MFFLGNALYNWGFTHGSVLRTCVAAVPKQLSYPKTKKEMKAFIKMYKAGAGGEV